MPRVAILGSCITRDLWPVRGQGMDDVLYISRTSLPSLFSAPIAGFAPAEDRPVGLQEHQHRSLVSDLTKAAIGRLDAFRPTHLIFDFIDERFDLIAVGKSLATCSWELNASGYLHQAAFKDARVIPRLSGACDRLWLRASEEFAALVRATPLKGAHLILHAARWAQASRSEEGRTTPLQDVEILAGRTVEVDAHNALLARYEAWFTELMPPMSRVEAAEHRISDEAHRWGLSPFHYVPEYYEEIRKQLAALSVPVPVNRAPAAPSVPAA
jgi:hypothetical protein